MPWSIFSDGGGKGAAVTWAQDLLRSMGLPQTPANVQFVYDWEVSEGGGGRFNPLNQGPVPGQPSLTSTGSQYGGGAADFVTPQAGIAGAAAYIRMPAYSGVLAALKRGNDYSGASRALWSSPWASGHYGYGSAWSTSAPPGASPITSPGFPTNKLGLPMGTGSGPIGSALGSAAGAVGSAAGSVFGALNPSTWLSPIFSFLGTKALLAVTTVGLVLLGVWLIAQGAHQAFGSPSPAKIATGTALEAAA